MQIAIVREESSFNPLLESTANAIGLTQMIAVTGKRFRRRAPDRGVARDPARPRGERHDRRASSATCSSTGSASRCWCRVVTTPAGLTRAACSKLRGTLRRGTEFVEAISTTTFRNYTKRVLGRTFTYSWLYEQAVRRCRTRSQGGCSEVAARPRRRYRNLMRSISEPSESGSRCTTQRPGSTAAARPPTGTSSSSRSASTWSRTAARSAPASSGRDHPRRSPAP